MKIIASLITGFLFFTMASFSAQAQEDFIPLDFDNIESEISNSGSKNYYPKLLDRYMQADSTLTRQDYRLLYYGFTFQDNYQPEKRADNVYALDRHIPSLNTPEEYAALKQAVQDILILEPFNLRAMNYLLTFSAEHESEEVRTAMVRRYSGILDAILSSGDGGSLETGFFVNYSEDKYIVLTILGLQNAKMEYDGNVDVHLVKENESGVTGIYFDVSRMRFVGASQSGIDMAAFESEEVPEGGIIKGSEDEIIEHIPLGYVTLAKENEDLDGDGDTDWVVVLKKEGEAMLTQTMGNPSLRPVLILLRAADGLFDRKLRNDNLVLCAVCTEGSEDPFVGLEVEENKFTINLKGGSVWKWERGLTFTNNNGQWMLTEDKNISYRKSKPNKKNEAIDTPEDFGDVKFEDVDLYKE